MFCVSLTVLYNSPKFIFTENIRHKNSHSCFLLSSFSFRVHIQTPSHVIGEEECGSSAPQALIVAFFLSCLCHWFVSLRAIRLSTGLIPVCFTCWPKTLDCLKKLHVALRSKVFTKFCTGDSAYACSDCDLQLRRQHLRCGGVVHILPLGCKRIAKLTWTKWRTLSHHL